MSDRQAYDSGMMGQDRKPGMENRAFETYERDASSRDVSGRTLTVALAFVLIVFVVLMIALVVR